ncbi:MAG: phage tail protein [Acidimicrobiales bacterium]
MPDAFDDAIPTGKFLIEVDGLEIGKFAEVSGLSVDVHVETVEEGGENQFVHKLPGRMEWPNVVLKRGVTKSDNLFDWLSKSSGEGFAGAGSKLTRRSAAIVLLGTDGARLRSWELSDAFAVKWSGPHFAATSTEAATEELEIAHHGFRATGH